MLLLILMRRLLSSSAPWPTLSHPPTLWPGLAVHCRLHLWSDHGPLSPYIFSFNGVSSLLRFTPDTSTHSPSTLEHTRAHRFDKKPISIVTRRTFRTVNSWKISVDRLLAPHTSYIRAPTVALAIPALLMHIISFFAGTHTRLPVPTIMSTSRRRAALACCRRTWLGQCA
ncbi:hypothetical protein B0H10DRAFT_2449306 [Mycena sp. CBHHK59/15]|nr:hypothetical protein B0H10DRAFT_2449306 [Mycena sp. CBHHK59/15]